MIEERLKIFSRVSLLLDVGFTVLAFYLAYLLRAFVIPLPEGALPLEFASLVWLLFVIVPVWIILLPYEGAYITLEKRARDTYYPLLKAVVIGTLLLFTVVFMLKLVSQSRLFIILFSLIDLLLLLLLRVWIFPLLASREKKRIFLIGNGENIPAIRGFLKSSPIRLEIKEFPGDIKNFESIASDWVDWVVIASPPEDISLYDNIVGFCREMGVPVSFVMKGEQALGRVRVDTETYSGFSLFTVSTAPEVSFFLTLKYVIDRIIALLLLAFLSPLLFMIAFIIKIESKGPAIFKQRRCGLNGRVFNMYKFRTMREGSHEEIEDIMHMNVMGRIVFKAENDPRITRVGKFLRRFSFDELPQIFNCIKGDMTMVGPRPPIPEEVKKYKPLERRRLSVKPGLTCIWQVSGRNEIDFDRWMELDLEYIDNLSPFLDIKILMFTIPAIVSGKGAY